LEGRGELLKILNFFKAKKTAEMILKCEGKIVNSNLKSSPYLVCRMTA
jgi:hypothetical protein